MDPLIFTLMLFVDGGPDPARLERYTTMGRCVYDIERTVEWAEAAGHSLVHAGCAYTPLAPLAVSVRPNARPEGLGQ